MSESQIKRQYHNTVRVQHSSTVRWIFDESSKLQSIRLERQQALQKVQLRELKEFAEAYSNDKLPPLTSERERQNSEHGSIGSEQSYTSSQTSIGKVSL